MIKYLIAFLISLGCPVLAHASVNCDLASGASISSIQAAVAAGVGNNCTVAGNVPNGHTVFFQAGSFTISAQVPIGCPTSSGLLITGPTPTGVGTTWPITPTALLTSTLGANWAFFGNACGNGTTIQYLRYNGNNPSGGGGGFLYASPAMNHLTVTYNWFYGNSAIQATSHPSDTFIWFDGSPVVGSTRTTNATITWNRFGFTGSSDCANLMNVLGGNNACVNNGSGGGYVLGGSAQCWYQDNNVEKSSGGYCAAVGIHVNSDNFTLSNNSVQTQEQAFKFFIGCGGGCPDNYKPTNVTMNANDFAGIHRIGVEAQQGSPGPWIETNNDIHDEILFDGVSWGLSLPQDGPQTITGNVLIEQNDKGTDKYGNGAARSYAIEYWGGPTLNNNLIQGLWGGSVAWGYNNITPWFVNNNTFQQLPTYFESYVSQEEGNTNAPSQSGNVESNTVSAFGSMAPNISPTPSGTYSSAIAVTITDNGYTSGTLPLGNTSIYYTIDGSAPTTSSTWCASPCSLSVTPGTTVNAIGMWGALNQPKSYPAGYGFVPSSVVGAHYSAGSTPTLTGVTLSLQGGGTSVQVSKSVQACATASYTVVSPVVTCGNGPDTYGTTFGTWASSSGNATITTAGNVSGVAPGSSNLTVKATNGATNFTSPNFGLNVTPLTQQLTSLQLSCPLSIQQGQTGNCTALCNYTGPQQTNCTMTDQFGNVAGGWASSVPAFATVVGPAVTGVAVGTTQISASAGGFPASAPVQITSSSPPAATLTGLTVSCSAGSVTVGSTINCLGRCAYSDGTFTNCTTIDAHGNTAGSWTSSVTADATINATTGVLTGVAIGSTNVAATAGIYTATALTVPVVAAPGITILGNVAFDTAGATYPNNINATYAVIDANQHKVQACTFYLPTGSTYTAGSKWDCGLIPAPTATTQSSSWLCWNTYVTTGTSADYGWHTVTLNTCGILPAHTAYWVGVSTNEAGPIGEGYSLCGGVACTGSAPTVGNGTYPCFYVSASYGVYTGMGTAMSSGCGLPGVQGSQYATLTTPTASLTGGYLANPGPTVIISVNGAVQFSVYCQYSDGSVNLCYPTPDQYGNTVTAFSSSDTSKVTIGNIGSTHPGLAQGIAAGTSNIQATLTGGSVTSTWGLLVSGTPLPYPPSTVKVLSR